MPIRPENKGRYPKNWKEIRDELLEAAGHRCQWCGVENHSIRENGSRVVLTIAHMDHKPENVDPSNLGCFVRNAIMPMMHSIGQRPGQRRRKRKRIKECWK